MALDPVPPPADLRIFQARSLYRELFLRLPLPVFLLDAGTLKVLDCSDSACEQYAYTHEQMVNISFLQLHRREDHEWARQHLRADKPGRYSAIMVSRDGQENTVELDVSASTCEGSSCLLVTSQRASQGIADLIPEHFSNSIAAQVPVLMWTVDADLRFTTASLPAEQTGLRAGNPIGQTLFEFFQTSDASFLPIAKHLLALQGASVSYDFQHLGRTFDSHLEPLRSDNGKMSGVIGVAMDITEQLRVQKLMRTDDERNRELIENASDIIYSHDLFGNFTAVSAAAEQITGYSHEEAMSMNIEQVVAPESIEHARNVIHRKLAGLPVQSPYDITILAKSGKRIVLELNTKLIVRKGTPVGVQGVGRDVTARKLAEEAVRESESKFRAVAETAPAAIFIYQNDQFRYVNSATEFITGFTSAELMKIKLWDLIHPQHRDTVKARAISRQNGEGAPQRYEFKIITKQSEERWLDYTAGIIQFEGQQAVLGTAFDITQRKATEEELQVQKAYLEELFQSAPEGIVILTNDGLVLRANREFARMFGYSHEEMRSSFIDDLIVPEDEREAALQLARTINAGNPFSVTGVRHRRDGTALDVSILGTPIHVAHGQIGRYVIYRDITEQRRADRYRDTQFATTRALAESKTIAEASELLLQAMGNGVGWDFMRMWFVDAASKVLRLQSMWASPAFSITQEIRAMVELGFGEGISGNVWATGDAAWITDVCANLASSANSTEHACSAAGLHSCFAVPVNTAGTVYGILEFYSTTARHPDFELLKMMGDIGTQVGHFVERKHAEDALIESESKFRAVADTAASAIYIHANNRFLYANRASELISGYPREELMALPVWEIAHPRFREVMQERADSRKAGAEAPSRYEFEMITKAGEPRWLDFSAAVIQFEGQTAILATAFDITERKRAEQLQSALYRIANLTSAAKDLDQLYAAIHQIVGELMYARNFYIALFDEETQLIHFPYFVDEEDPAPPPPQQCLRGLTDYVLRNGKPLLADPIKFEELVALGEAETRGAPSLDWLGVPLKIGDRTFGVLTVQSYDAAIRFGPEQQDILNFVSQQVASAIEHRRSQDALQKSEMRYRSQVQSAAYGIYRSSVGGQFLDVNPALVEMLGYDAGEELMTMDMARDLYAEPGQRQRILEELVGAARIEGVETHWKRKDGRIITVRLSGRAGLHYPGEPESFEMIAEDITERRTLEEQLRHSQKMEAVGRLAGGVAHDFNNLLTVIKGYSDLMLNEIAVNDPMYGELDEIRKAADRAASLTRQLLAFSRRQVMEPKVLDLNGIVSNMERLLRRLLGEDVELHISLHQHLGHVKADPGQIEQVIMNLAVNARDAMPRGGKLTIETTNFEVDEEYTRDHAVVAAGKYVMLAVSDTGCGMDSETVQHIFEPFFTTKEMGKGTGLGLSTVYGIVKQSGGYIWVYSEPGGGSSFKVYLPVVEQRAETMDKKAAPAASYRGTELVLLVEDEDGVRALVREVLQRHGYTVLETRSGGEALIAFEKNPNIQLLLTDVVLAQMNGRELAKRLAPQRPEMKVLFVSGYTEEAIVQHGVLDPGTAFLQKPFTPKALAKKVREVLDGVSEE